MQDLQKTNSTQRYLVIRMLQGCLYLNLSAFSVVQELHQTKFQYMRPIQAPKCFFFEKKAFCNILKFIEPCFTSIKFIYSEKATKLCEISTVDLYYRGSSLSTNFGIWKKSYYAKFVLVCTTQPISTSTILLHSNQVEIPLVLILYLQL